MYSFKVGPQHNHSHATEFIFYLRSNTCTFFHVWARLQLDYFFSRSNVILTSSLIASSMKETTVTYLDCTFNYVELPHLFY